MSEPQIAQPPSDEHLCREIAARGGSKSDAERARAACGELFARHGRPMMAFLSPRVLRGHDVDDVSQAIWQRVWQSLPDGFQGGNFRAWLFQIARNYLVDLARKPRTEAIPADFDVADAEMERPEVFLLEHERMARLARCLEGLESTLSAIVRARLSGEDYDLICQRINVPSERAHRLFHSAKRQLQDCVGSDDP